MEWSNPLAAVTARLKDNPITRKIEQRDRLIRLLTEYRAHQEYPWFQGTEQGVVFTGGICHGMSFDWLRRKFLNKRNYNDARYASQTKNPGDFSFLSKVKDLVLPEQNEKRKAVMLKAGEIQAGFYNELRLNRERWHATFQKLTKTKSKEDLTMEDMLKEDSSLVYPDAHDAETQILKKFARSRTKKMRGLEYFNVSAIKGDWLDNECMVKGKGDVSAFLNEHIAMMALEPSGLQRGLMVSFRDENEKLKGHATAIYHNRTDSQKTFVFFDPNCGEFFWDKAYDVGVFVGELWAIAYSELKKMEFRTIVLDPSAVPAKNSSDKEKEI
jgi:hypothetical protein